MLATVLLLTTLLLLLLMRNSIMCRSPKWKKWQITTQFKFFFSLYLFPSFAQCGLWPHFKHTKKMPVYSFSQIDWNHQITWFQKSFFFVLRQLVTRMKTERLKPRIASICSDIERKSWTADTCPVYTIYPFTINYRYVCVSYPPGLHSQMKDNAHVPIIWFNSRMSFVSFRAITLAHSHISVVIVTLRLCPEHCNGFLCRTDIF